jgi:cytochrome P450
VRGSKLDRVLVAAAPWPLLAMCSSPRFARIYRRRAAEAAAYLGLYAIVLVAVALVGPWLLIPCAVLAAFATAVLAWRMRVNSGRSKRLPPGRLQLFPVRPVTDHDFVSGQIARHGPVSKATMPHIAHPLVLVGGLARGSSVLRANDGRLEWVGMSFDSMIPAGFIRSMNPDDHRYYIRILRDAFSDSVVEECRPAFSRLARAELARMQAAGGATGEIDPRPWLGQYALASLARLILGVEQESDDFATAVGLYGDPGPLNTEWGGDAGVLREALAEASALLRRQAAAVADATARGDEPASSFLAELVRRRPDAVEDDNVALNLVFLLATTYRDLTGLLHWIVKMLGDNPEWCDRLRTAGAEDDLASRVVFETLRLEQSEFILRRVLEPVEIEGYVVPAGWYLRVCVRESHRDPAVFADPERFNPDRFLGARHTREEYSPLGMTNRPCTGVATTLAIAGVLAEELARGWTLATVRDGRPEFDGAHWRPSKRFRARMMPHASDGSELRPADAIGAV